MLITNLNIHNWNVRGLEIPDRKYVVRSWCNKLKHKNIICLQEIKTMGYHAYNTLKFIWDKATCFFSGHQRGKGGVALLISPCWMSNIIEHDFHPVIGLFGLTLKLRELELESATFMPLMIIGTGQVCGIGLQVISLKINGLSLVILI